MILTVVDWILRSFNLFVNIWLFFSIRRSAQAMKIYVFVVIYFIISHDILAGFVGIFHDVPSYYHNDSILTNFPMLSGTCVIIMSLQWFFQLLFLPAFSLIHFCALFFPLPFRRLINRRAIIYIIIFLYSLTAMLTVPLFTSYVAFIYHPDGNYWGTDLNKPYNFAFTTVNNGIQAVCLTVMVTCNILIIYKLALYRKTNVTSGEVRIVSTTRGSGNEQTSTDNCLQNKKFVVSPETRLAVSYIHLSGCFFTKTLAYNLILGNTNNPFLAAVYLLTHYLNSFKWILYWFVLMKRVLFHSYSLGNKKIRQKFFSTY